MKRSSSCNDLDSRLTILLVVLQIGILPQLTNKDWLFFIDL